MRYRLLQYNILEGFRTDRGTMALDCRRLIACKEFVKAHEPDILVLNEANYCQIHDGTWNDYKTWFDMPYGIGQLYDRQWGNVILSKYPIIDWRVYRMENRRAALKTFIQLDRVVVEVDTYHPHPKRYADNKARDFANLTYQLQWPYILSGDFNVVSPSDLPDRERLTAGFVRLIGDELGPAVAAQFIDGGTVVIKALTDNGLRDAVRAYLGKVTQHTIPTDMLNMFKGTAMRLDHVFVSGHIQVDYASIPHDDLTHKISDHYPVIVDFSIL